MEASPLNSIQTNLSKQKRLYDRFRRKCQEQGISLKTGLREALLLWFHRDMGDKEFTRYLAQEQARREILGYVRSVRSAKSVSEARKYLDLILQEY